jgi:hypothetical protein
MKTTINLNQMKNKTLHTDGPVPKYNRNVVETGKIGSRPLFSLTWYRHFNKKWQH